MSLTFHNVYIAVGQYLWIITHRIPAEAAEPGVKPHVPSVVFFRSDIQLHSSRAIPSQQAAGHGDDGSHMVDRCPGFHA